MANPKIQLRHDTSANWQTQNPVLLEGEVAIETDSNKVKIGNGTDNYNTLPYITDQTKIDLDYSNANYQPVNKSGDTMTGNLDILKNNPNIILKKSSFTKGTNPSSNMYWEYKAEDNNTSPAEWYTNRVSNLVTTVFTDGTVDIAMLAYQNNPNSNTAASIRAWITSAGVASCSFPNTTCCDGQWVKKWQVVFTGVKNVNTYSYGISSYLPDNSHAYEVICQLYLDNSNATSGANCWGAVSNEASPYSNQVVSIRGVTDTTSGMSVNTGVLFFPADSRTLYAQLTGNALTGGANCILMGYRRIGTNA